MFDPIPGRERPHPTRIRFKLTKVCVNRLHLLVYAPVCPALHPPADLLEDPSGIQLRKWRLDDGCQSNTPYHLAPVTTRSIPHQRFDVRVMLGHRPAAIAADLMSRSIHNSLRGTSGTGTSTCRPSALADAPSLHDGPTPCGPSPATPLASHRQSQRPYQNSRPLRQGRNCPLFPRLLRTYVCLLMTGPRNLRAASQPLKRSSLHTRTLRIPAVLKPARHLLGRDLGSKRVCPCLPSCGTALPHLPLYTGVPSGSSHSCRRGHSPWSVRRTMSCLPGRLPSVPPVYPPDSNRFEGSTHHRAPQHSMLATAWINYKNTASYFQLSLSSNDYGKSD